MELFSPKTLPDDQNPDHTAALQMYIDLRQMWERSPSEAVVHLQQLTTGDRNSLHIDYAHLLHLLRSAIIDHSAETTKQQHFADWVFQECAKVLTSAAPDSSVLDHESWSHAAAYLFRGAAYTPLSERSLLDLPSNHAIAAALIAEEVAFCELSASLGAIAVLSRGIIASNVRWWADNQNISSFFFRPAALSSPLFSRLLTHQVELEREKHRDDLATPAEEHRRLSMPYSLLQRFCTESSPAAFLHWALSNHISIPLPQSVALLQPLVARSDAGYVKEYEELTPPGCTSSVPGQMTTAVSLDLKKGVFIDVFGTLINPNDGSVNEGLLRLIQGLMAQTPPRSVFLVSDSPEEDLKRVLSPITAPLPPILAKSDLQSDLLEWLIDDSDPEAQNLHALNYIEPGRSVELTDSLLTDSSRFI